MAQGKNSNTYSDGGVCRRIYNAVSPLRATIRRISHQPQGSTEIAKPVVQPKMIPIEHDSPSQDKQVPVVNGWKIGKPGSKKRAPDHHAENPAHGHGDHHKNNHVSFEKVKSKKDDDNEAKFSDYISRVKSRLMKAMSNVRHENNTA